MNLHETAFVFPGQGSQYPKMAEKLYFHTDTDLRRIARHTFEEADTALQMDMGRICLEATAEELKRTNITQPAIVATSIAALRMLQYQGVNPHVVAGHSLGEYSALVAAEALSFEQALLLVKARGEFMGHTEPGKMAAVLNMSLRDIEKICSDSGAEVANINSEGQIVITGLPEEITVAQQLVKDVNGKIIVLNVGIGSHGKLMQKARTNLEIFITDQKVNIDKPHTPFISGFTGNYATDSSEIQRYILDGMTGRVLWLDSVRLMIKDGVTEFVEVGPGTVLSKIIERITKEKPEKGFHIQNTDTIFSAT